MKKYLIVANGQFPTREEVVGRIQEADYIACCDGAIAELESRGVMPHCIIGDMDSIDATLRERYRDIICQIDEQETNDLTKAFYHCLKRIKEGGEEAEICIIGATGKREDHTIGNVSLLSDYVREFPAVEMVSDYGVFRGYTDSFSRNEIVGTEISIFAFDPTLKITSEGLEYPTGDVVFDLWWKATLNRTNKESYTLTLSHSSSIVVFTNFVNLPK